MMMTIITLIMTVKKKEIKRYTLGQVWMDRDDEWMMIKSQDENNNHLMDSQG